MALETDQVIDGKYRIVRVLGAGGMGEVYEGENVLIRRRVAIKVLHASTSTNADAIRRFEREAQAAGQIGSDHILEVLDLGVLPSGDRYMVMEYLDGETLADRMSRHGRLTPREIAPLARQFLAALVAAHAAGIIHRDLKPDNIFILRSKAGRSDFVKLIDFGISKFSNLKGVDRTTHAGSLLGTPCYMSPEQARGRGEADLRSDIYSCGVILFEAVTGKLPFEGDSFNDLMFKIALSETPSALSIIPSLDPDFVWIISRAMARSPADRFQTVQEFSEKLDEWMRKNDLTGTLAQPLPSDAFPSRERTAAETAPTVVREVGVLELTETGTEESWARSHDSQARGTSRKKGAIIAAAVAALLAVVGIVIVLAVGKSPPEKTAAAGPAAPAASQPTQARVEDPVPPPAPVTTAPAATESARPQASATPSATAKVVAAPKATQGSGKPAAPPRPAGSAGKGLDFGY